VRNCDVHLPAQVVDNAVQSASGLVAKNRLWPCPEHGCPQETVPRQYASEGGVHAVANPLPATAADEHLEAPGFQPSGSGLPAGDNAALALQQTQALVW
jgi:hypothetical protein